MEFNQNPNPLPPKPRRLRRISAIAGAGMLAGLMAVAVGGVASAQAEVDVPSPVADVQLVDATAFAQGDEDSDPSGETPDLSADDDAIFERFEACLRDAGIDVEAEEPEASSIDEEAIDAAFDSCEPILDELSDDAFGGEISPEDEGVFERFDQCLEDAGVDIETEEDLDDATLDAAFEQCDPILDDLSEDFAGEFDDDFGDLSAEDEAVFDQYDTCLEAGGIDALFDAEDVDEAALDALFEKCEPVLDGLSEDAQALFEDCPEDEGHDDEASEADGA